MAVTLTIKRVPEPLAEALRERAAANRRSQQQELLLILERAVVGPAGGDPRVQDPAPAVYRVGRGEVPRKARSAKPVASRPSGGKLSLDALWRRARKLGSRTPSEAAAIVRADRDAGRR